MAREATECCRKIMMILYHLVTQLFEKLQKVNMVYVFEFVEKCLITFCVMVENVKKCPLV